MTPSDGTIGRDIVTIDNFLLVEGFRRQFFGSSSLVLRKDGRIASQSGTCFRRTLPKWSLSRRKNERLFPKEDPASRGL